MNYKYFQFKNYMLFIIPYYILFIKLRIISCEYHFIEFKSKNYRYGQIAFNLNGDMIIEYSYKKYRLFYGLKQNGKSYFKDENQIETAIKEIEISDDLYNRKYTKNIFISLNNDINEQFLFSIGDISEIHNLTSDKYIIKKTNNYLAYYIFSSLVSILHLDDLNQYVIIYLEKLDKNCIIQKLFFSDFSLVPTQIIKTQRISTKINHKAVNGFKMNENIIVFYLNGAENNYKHYINIYNYNLEIIKEDIEIGAASLKEDSARFFKGLHLKNNLMAFSYFTPNNLEFKIGYLNNDYIFKSIFIENIKFGVFYISALGNDFIKLNDERLVFISLIYPDNSKFSIILFDLYNNYNYMKIRKYNNLNLNNEYRLAHELELCNYNDFIGLIASVYDFSFLSDTELTENDYYSIFMIFGYINGTDEYINISDYLSDDYINNTKNIYNKLMENKEIENNIFGYILLKEIKLISIPLELLLYDRNNTLLLNNSILNDEEEYILKQNDKLIKNSEYYHLDYQNIISEPDYNTFNNKASDIINKKSSETSGSFVDQKTYYYPRKYYGRTNSLKFKLCHEYCKTCYKFSISNDNQQCMSCLPLYSYYYYNEFPSNCVPEGYYNDNEKNKLIECSFNNSKFYINETDNKRICFDNKYKCPDEYPLFNNLTNQCFNLQIPSSIPLSSQNSLSSINSISTICNPNDFFKNECISIPENMIDIIINYIKNGEMDFLINKTIKENKTDLLTKQNNIKYQITSTYNQKNNIYGNISIINLGKCEEILKKQNNLEPDDILIIFKYDIEVPGIQIPLVGYLVFDPKEYKPLDLNCCKKENTKIEILYPAEINESIYKKINPKSEYYKNKCNSYSNENKVDMTLYDRKNEFNNKNLSLCADGCEFSDYNFQIKKAICYCDAQTNSNSVLDKLINKERLLSNFKDIKKTINLSVIKCFKIFFSKDGLKYNIGNYLLIIIFLFYTITIFIFYLKGFNLLIQEIKEIIKQKLMKSNNKPNDNNIITSILYYPPKKIKKILKKKIKSKLNNKIISNASDIKNSNDILNANIKINNIDILNNKIEKNDLIDYLDSELNVMTYEDAIKYDKRGFWKYYFSFLKLKHYLLFSFYPIKDYNSKIIKIFLFFFFFALYFFINCLFFNDGTMHQIYEDNGAFNFIYSLPQILYSTIISGLIGIIIKYFSLSDKDLIDLKNEKNLLFIKNKELKTIKCLKIKFGIFFALSFILLFLFWIYLGCFCAVYKNTQINLIKDTMISLALCLSYPFIIYFIPSTLRYLALQKNYGKFLYLLTRLISYI